MDVGIFDLLERGNAPLADVYEFRLRLAERYDRGGFYSYHLAEHHATPHGIASSPSVFLAALAQRTTRLRFGAMVYLLPYYHPLRLIEEVCILDQLSRGRVDVGFGRSASPLERKIYGIPPDDAQRLFIENLRILRLGLTSDVLDFTGEFHSFSDVVLKVRPYQQPPPLWYGTSSLAGVEFAAQEGVNLITSSSAEFARKQAERYWEVRSAAGLGGAPPRVGLARKVVLAETDAEAEAIAARVYAPWLADWNYHAILAGAERRAPEPPTWEEFKAEGKGVAGTPDTVAAMLTEQLRDSPFTYSVVEFFWGPMTFAEVERSVNLFARHVLPAIAYLTNEAKSSAAGTGAFSA